MALKELITADVARQLLRYDPESGKLFWLPRPESMFPSRARWLAWTKLYEGKEALGTRNGHGHKGGRILGQTAYAHRVVILLATGEWPIGDVDHIDGDEANNRLENLRDVPTYLNCRNCKLSARNKSGINGVSWHKRDKKWYVNVRVHGQLKYLGRFDKIEDATAARLAVNGQYGFTARHGQPLTDSPVPVS
jgi:hypothetical protein